jgi:hypothetical protein
LSDSNFWDKKTYKNLGTIDLDTGEILQGVPVYLYAKVKWREDWFMGIQEAFIALAKDKEIRGRTRSVLDYMFGKLAFENYICIQQKEIVEALEINKTNVSKAIKLLLQRGIILPGPKLGRTTSYRLNSGYGWKGKVINLADERSKTDLKLVPSL